MFASLFVKVRVNNKLPITVLSRGLKSCGIVGLPNIGKSTLFNALTKTQLAEAANYPFCTIEPNKATISVPDERLTQLAILNSSRKVVKAQMQFIDIAGLVKGASKGNGLGNQFLSNIRNVDMILHVLRCFEDPDIIHVENTIDPVRDLEIVNNELLLADLQLLEKQKDKLKSSNDKLANQVLDKSIACIYDEKPLSSIEYTEKERSFLQLYNLLTIKPMLYVLHVDIKDVVEGNTHSKKAIEYIKSKSHPSKVSETSLTKEEDYVVISAKLEEEASEFEDEESQLEYLKSSGVTQTGIKKIAAKANKLLNINTFYTTGEDESRAWFINKGDTAVQAAGCIHTDFIKKFVKAETISYEDYILYKTESAARTAGKIRAEGKSYICQDGDVFNFLISK
ncbi:hypothetical protein WA158_005378 [Blastocystis sp. Blastoise]